MTIGEINRAIDSSVRRQKMKAQERASYDYILANLIGRSISRIYSSSARMPAISEAYPTLFDSEQEKQAELSAIRFKQFASSYNKKFKGVANKNE